MPGLGKAGKLADPGSDLDDGHVDGDGIGWHGSSGMALRDMQVEIEKPWSKKGEPGLSYKTHPYCSMSCNINQSSKGDVVWIMKKF